MTDASRAAPPSSGGDHRSDRSRPRGRGLLVAPLVLGAVQAALFLFFFVRALHPIPRWDLYDWATGYLEADSTLRFLWALHNEHRLVVSKALVLLDVELFRGLLAPISYAAAASLAAWAWVIARRFAPPGGDDRGEDRRGDPDAGAWLAGWSLVAMFPTYSLDNYTYPTNVQYTFVVLFAVLAFDGLVRWAGAGRTPRHAALGVAWIVVAGTLASLSSANGLLVWPILVALGWWIGASRPALAAFALAGGAQVALHLRDRGGAAAGALASASDLPALATYLAEYFGMPWVTVPAAKPIGMLLGAATLLLVGLCVLHALLRRASLDAGRRFAIALLLFSLGSAVLTAAGRMREFAHPAHRYTVLMILAQCGLLLYARPPLAHLARRPAARRVLLILPLVAAPLVIGQQIAIGRFAVERAESFAQTGARLLAGERSLEVTQPIYPDVPRLEHHLEVQRRAGIYLFRSASAPAGPAGVPR